MPSPTVIFFSAAASTQLDVVELPSVEKASPSIEKASPSIDKPNILYLMADDMRPQLGCYGQAEMKTPHLDKLAQEGLIFDRAYTQFAYCAPSRNSFMSGRRPERTRVLNFDTTFRKVHGDSWVTMPQYFKNAGYFTTAAGKLYHDGEDDAASWSHGLGNPLGSNQTHWIQCQCAKACIHNSQKRVTSRLQHTTNPVFAPRVCGQGDLCDNHSSTGVNYCGITPSSATQYTDEDLVLHEGLARLDAALASDRRWYYAATSYADHMLGKALTKLESVPSVAARTITVFHADHGYQLGELNEWSKKTNTELSARVPMILRVPWKSGAIGQRSSVAIELVDMYRTLAALAGLDQVAPLQTDIQGMSIAPLFDSPKDPPAALANKVAYSQIGSCACREYTSHGWKGPECGAGRCIATPVALFDFMGYSMRTPEWRFTAWVPMGANSSRVDWSKRVYHELYDVDGDGMGGKPLDFDWDGYAVNVAAHHPELVKRMHAELKSAVDSWY